jgi:hypothetical protein
LPDAAPGQHRSALAILDKGEAILSAWESVHSQQEGARAFAIGTFQAIRNPAHHVHGDRNPLTAFHHLAALSQVAHYFRNWKVVTYSPPPPDLSKLTSGNTID